MSKSTPIIHNNKRETHITTSPLPYVHTTICPQRPSHKVVTKLTFWFDCMSGSTVRARRAGLCILLRIELAAIASVNAALQAKRAITVFHFFSLLLVQSERIFFFSALLEQ